MWVAIGNGSGSGKKAMEVALQSCLKPVATFFSSSVNARERTFLHMRPRAQVQH